MVGVKRRIDIAVTVSSQRVLQPHDRFSVRRGTARSLDRLRNHTVLVCKRKVKAAVNSALVILCVCLQIRPHLCYNIRITLLFFYHIIKPG